jgi:hypothetical protein
MYALRDSGGQIYRIPKKFDADDVEDGLEIAMNEKLPKMLAAANNPDYVFNGTLAPFLTPTEDGIAFTSIKIKKSPSGMEYMTNELVTDAKGQPIVFRLQDLVGTKKVRPINTYKPVPKGGM